jgi:superfamily II DNA/RNA helicase
MCSKSLYCLKTGVSFCLPSSSLKVYFIFDSLKSCEPEFLVSTPERLLELVNSKAIDISGVSLLVISFGEY